MYARVTRTKADPARTDELVAQLKSQLLPIFEQQNGYLGTVSVANRETGQGATTTYWDSMDHLRASERAIFAARDKFAQEHRAETVSVHRVEIPIQERRRDPKAGAHIRAVTLTGANGTKLDQIVSSFREQVLPVALALPGCRAAVMHIDRENNIAIGVSSYDTAEQRDAASTKLDPLRDKIAQDLGLKAETQHAEVTFADVKVPVAH